MRDAVETAIKSANHLLVVSYSPTGGGHTGRTFSIIEQAMADGHLAKGDTVVFHCPPKWEGLERDDINQITGKLQKSGINVVFALADKTVYGYLKPDGSSDDARILQRFASYPKREISNNLDIRASGVLWTPEMAAPAAAGQAPITPTQHIYSKGAELTITAKHLMQSITEARGAAGKDQIYVLTDMDPYLQKAAIKAGIPPDHCLDQQNHAILLRDGATAAGPSTYGLLAKVLSASGGQISHIGLGDRNTLLPIKALAESLHITPETTRAQAKQIVVDKLHMEGKRIDLTQPYSKTAPGIMWPPDLAPSDVKQVVYVYAHNNTPAIGEHIRQKIQEKDPSYTDKVFLFCGAAAVGKYNAMHLAYLAEADGITTAGAGTTGEFAYLHRNADDQSSLLLLPIRGHNEQEANAEYIQHEFKDLVLLEKEVAGVNQQVDALVQQKPSSAAPLFDRPIDSPPLSASSGYLSSSLSPSESESLLSASASSGYFPSEASSPIFKDFPVSITSPDRTMSSFITAVSDAHTYSKQASDSLFTGVTDEKTEKLREMEVSLRNDKTLKIDRRYLKLTFQLLEQIAHETSHDASKPYTVKFSQHGNEFKFNSIEELQDLFKDESKLLKLLTSETSKSKIEEEITATKGTPNLVSREKMINFLTKYKEITAENQESRARESEEIKEEIGVKITTGF